MFYLRRLFYKTSVPKTTNQVFDDMYMAEFSFNIVKIASMLNTVVI